MPHPIRRWLAREDGAVSVEAMLALPMLIWAYVGSYVFFDAFHSRSINTKAAFTIGNALSVEDGYVTPEYMDSLYALQDVLVTEDVPPRLRVTAFRFREDDDTHQVVWSEARGGGPALTTATIAQFRDRIPLMADGHVSVLTETWVDHHPAFEGLLDPFTYEDFAVMPTRDNGGQLCWNSDNDYQSRPDLGLSTAVC